MKNLKDIIVERLHINKDTGNNVHHYNYHPTTIYELEELVNKLIKERGNNADLNDIDTSEITDMNYMFGLSNFNGDISKWDVSKVEDMNFMFAHSKFDGDLSNWDVSKVEDMHCMFRGSNFNGDISNWDVSNVKYMRNMFDESPLEKNQPKWYKE